MVAHIVDTREAVAELVNGITTASTTPFIFIDLEGIDLSRQGSISVLQLLAPPAPTVHLVDIFNLQSQAFETAGTTEKTTLKDILESDKYVKVFFDVRNDSDALFSHFKVKLSGVIDLQLVEYASRPNAGRFIKGLAKCISETVSLTWTERQKWSQVKEAGQKLFAPEKGGSYEVFNQRPLPDALQQYCAQDVLMLPRLLASYAAGLPPHLAAQVADESRKRVSQSQGANYNGKGSHMALAPSFRWNRPALESALKFPVNVLCSTELGRYCTVCEEQTVVPKAATVTSMDAKTLPKAPTAPSVPNASSSPLDLSSGTSHSLARMLDDLHRNDSGDEQDLYISDDLYERSSYGGEWDRRSSPDYTACSASDCGYCGRCGY